MLFQKFNIENYKKIINEIIVNKEIKEEILEKINYFDKNGDIFLDGYNFYAKNKKSKDFLELKYASNYFLCIYTDWNLAKTVTITKKDLKNNYSRIERKEKVDYRCDDNKTNSSKIEELEEIYNSDKKLTYKSKLSKDINYYTNSNDIIYENNHYFTNYFELNKEWYISNGSIINYKLKKSFMNEHSELEEHYSICPKTYFDGFISRRIFVDLDENLFKEFMSGKITIDEVLEKIDKKEYQKTLKKNVSSIDII